MQSFECIGPGRIRGRVAGRMCMHELICPHIAGRPGWSLGVQAERGRFRSAAARAHGGDCGRRRGPLSAERPECVDLCAYADTASKPWSLVAMHPQATQARQSARTPRRVAPIWSWLQPTDVRASWRGCVA